MLIPAWVQDRVIEKCIEPAIRYPVVEGAGVSQLQADLQHGVSLTIVSSKLNLIVCGYEAANRIAHKGKSEVGEFLVERERIVILHASKSQSCELRLLICRTS
eukprot:142737-Hanusia_phi.AAC.6